MAIPSTTSLPGGRWLFYLCDAFGATFATREGGVELKFRRNDSPEAVLTLDGESLEAIGVGALLAADPLGVAVPSLGAASWAPSSGGPIPATGGGLPLLFGYRDGVLRFAGIFASSEETAEDTGEMKLTFRGPFFHLAGRYVTTPSRAVYTAVDKGLIFQKLAADAYPNVCDYGGSRISVGALTACGAVTRSYPLGQNLHDALLDLSRSEGGMDFEVDPVWAPKIGYPAATSGETIGSVRVAPTLGSDVSGSVKMEHGTGTLANVKRIRRTFTLPYGSVTVTGANGLSARYSDPYAGVRYGGWMKTISRPDVTDAATLLAIATAAANAKPPAVVEIVPEPAFAPQPWRDYWLGDTIAVKARSGSLVFDATPRVNGIGVVVDENGVEAEHSLTFDQAV